jgi:bacterioferritin (cytochrome b1)
VFIKQLSREEVLELWRKESTDALASATTVAERVVLMMRGLGLVRRDETLAERFTRETGHEVTEAVEAALNWKGE